MGQRQGKLHDKDQITLRKEFLVKYGSKLYPAATRFVVMAISLDGTLVDADTMGSHTSMPHIVELTWSSVCGIPAHPMTQELQRYLKWKQANSKL